MIKRTSAWRRAADLTIAALTAAVVALFALMTALVFVQIIDRFVGLGWFWTEEVVRSLLVWTVMLGLPVVLYHHEEILVDVLVLSTKATRWRIRIASLLSLVFLALLAWQGWAFTERNASFTSPTLGVSRAWIYVPIPLGAALGCLALLVRAEDRAQGWPIDEAAPRETKHREVDRDRP